MTSDFPSVTHPWLAARERLGMRITWVEDTPGQDLTAALVDGISRRHHRGVLQRGPVRDRIDWSTSARSFGARTRPGRG